uniref:Putative secreted protein n=1 Tax=Anopheles triannulatus TaxID=58253 RepID=A0A2M4B409_9DIPT
MSSKPTLVVLLSYVSGAPPDHVSTHPKKFLPITIVIDIIEGHSRAAHGSIVHHFHDPRDNAMAPNLLR